MGTVELVGLIGGIAGGFLGVLGGIFGIWYSIRNTNGPREKALAVKAWIALWGLIALFIVGLFLLPNSLRHYLWIPYSILLFVGILVWNRAQARIRRQEKSERSVQ